MRPQEDTFTSIESKKGDTFTPGYELPSSSLDAHACCIAVRDDGAVIGHEIDPLDFRW
ncbi:MAG: hypothetical protein U5L96_09150 [Owenweeksia sp.]|nr:hypothetical protein [Owenweeksia sp.]